MKIPNAHFGRIDQPANWRKLDKDNTPDDDELHKIPKSVEKILKLNPHDVMKHHDELEHITNLLLDHKE